MSEQNAVRLAELLDERNATVYRKHATEAAAELRRLIAKIADLEEAVRVLSEVVAERNRLEAQRDELLEALEDAAHSLTDGGKHYLASVTYAIIAKAKGEQA